MIQPGIYPPNAQFSQLPQQQPEAQLQPQPQPAGPHPLDPQPGLYRTIIKLPHPRFPGGRNFFDTVPQRDATFAWSEICATPEPECSLAPVPQVQMKSWYNTYLYVPEKNSHLERQYLERFIQGENGEWIDVVKARRMANFLDEQREKEERIKRQRSEVLSGANTFKSGYTDAYTGEQLVAFHGELMPQEELWARNDIRPSLMMELREQQAEGEGFDFANLRVPWPFGRPDRNKMVSKHAYEWFDRRNAYIQSDRQFEMMELPSMYVDKEQYYRWATGNADSSNPAFGPLACAADRARYFDGYPYRV